MAVANSTTDDVDEVLLYTSGAMRARRQAQLSWAEDDARALRGDETVTCPSEALRAMSECFHRLAATRPKTIGGAREMLVVALDIMAHRVIAPGSRSTMNEAPLLEIISNVAYAMQGIDSETRLDQLHIGDDT